MANLEGKNNIYQGCTQKIIIFRNLYDMPKILKYLGHFEHFVPFHLAFVFSLHTLDTILSKVTHAVIHFQDGLFSTKHNLARSCFQLWTTISEFRGKV